MTYHLANMNIARFRYELGDPRLADFMDNRDKINGLGESSPGFVWRLKEESQDAVLNDTFEDPRIILNLAVWESIEALQLFAYRSEHVQFFRRRLEWFDPPEQASMALWWVKAGERPTAREARTRLEHIRTHGPTPEAFTFRERFSPPQ